MRDLLKNKQVIDEPYVFVKDGANSRSYTRREVAEEIKNETPEGVHWLIMLMNLAADLLNRGKV